MTNDPRKNNQGWGYHRDQPAPPAEPAQPVQLQEHARQSSPDQWGAQYPQYAYPPPPAYPYQPQFTPQPQQYVPPHDAYAYQQQQGYQLPAYLETPPGYPAAPAPVSSAYPQAYAYPHQYTPQAYAPTATQYAQPDPTAMQAMQPAMAPAATGKTKAEARTRMARGSERPIPSADATVGGAQRVRFVRLTYLHLLFAMLAFGGLLYLLMTQPILVEKVSYPLVEFALGGRWNWGVVLGVFVVVSWIADYWARHASSRGLQYAGLAFYVVAEALIFVPLLAIVEWKTQAILSRGGAEPHIIRDSAYLTLGIFTALTLSVFLMRKDFSFLRAGLMMATGAAASAVILSLVFGFNLGLIFSVGMVLLAAAYILYQTSEVLAHYDPRQHVAASLALFSSVALMFWYVIRIVTRSRQ